MTGSVHSFLRGCLKLVRNEQAITELQLIIDQSQPSSSVSSTQRAVHNITDIQEREERCDSQRRLENLKWMR